MAEEVKEEQQEETPSKSSGAMVKAGIAVGVIVAAVVGGLLFYRLVLGPMLGSSGEEEGEGEQISIPLNPVMVVFEDTFVNVMRDGDMPAATFLFGVTLECINQETADIIGVHHARFVDMLNKLHDSRTRGELDDVVVLKESIQRQALQKCNDLLRRIEGNPDTDNLVTAVFHQTFAVQDSV